MKKITIHPIAVKIELNASHILGKILKTRKHGFLQNHKKQALGRQKTPELAATDKKIVIVVEIDNKTIILVSLGEGVGSYKIIPAKTTLKMEKHHARLTAIV